MDRLLTTQEAAERAGVGPTAIKRWADQGLLPCVRTAGGHRRFHESAVKAFLAEQSSDMPTQASPEGRLVDALLDAESGHAVEAQLLAWRGEDGAWFRAANRLGLVLKEIGLRWERGELGIIEEHVLSERLHRAIARVSESLPVPPRAPEVLLAVVEGDDHVLGLAIVELCLREAGLRTRWAGRDVPLDELIKVIESGDAEIVAVSASIASTDAKRLERYARRLGGACEERSVDLLFGGTGAWPDSPRYGTRLKSFDELRAYLAGRS